MDVKDQVGQFCTQSKHQCKAKRKTHLVSCRRHRKRKRRIQLNRWRTGGRAVLAPRLYQLAQIRLAATRTCWHPNFFFESSIVWYQCIGRSSDSWASLRLIVHNRDGQRVHWEACKPATLVAFGYDLPDMFTCGPRSLRDRRNRPDHLLFRWINPDDQKEFGSIVGIDVQTGVESTKVRNYHLEQCRIDWNETDLELSHPHLDCVASYEWQKLKQLLLDFMPNVLLYDLTLILLDYLQSVFDID